MFVCGVHTVHTQFSCWYIVYQNRNPNQNRCICIRRDNECRTRKMSLHPRHMYVLSTGKLLSIRNFPYLLYRFDSIKFLINQAECVHNSDTYMLDTRIKRALIQLNGKARVLLRFQYQINK